MAKRLFSHDPTFGVTKYWHWDEMTDEVGIETVQDVEPLLERNKRLQNEQTSLDRWGDGKVVASIPMVEYAKLLAENRIRDQAYLRRWLNSSENRRYRTRLGRV